MTAATTSTNTSTNTSSVPSTTPDVGQLAADAIGRYRNNLDRHGQDEATARARAIQHVVDSAAAGTAAGGEDGADGDAAMPTEVYALAGYMLAHLDATHPGHRTWNDLEAALAAQLGSARAARDLMLEAGEEYGRCRAVDKARGALRGNLRDADLALTAALRQLTNLAELGDVEYEDADRGDLGHFLSKARRAVHVAQALNPVQD